MAHGKSVPLPATLTEFREESYWDDFFKASKGRPFEWYGAWPSLPKLFEELLGLRPDQTPAAEILVPGCGNSSLSAAMYDAGFKKITNVDFNKRVIMEMLRLNVRARPLMRWLVMDITKMQFADGSFDVVLDKGSLDALTGEPDEPQIAAKGLLLEVSRVLRPGGRYVCITLAQKHVIELLLVHFRNGWDVMVHQVEGDSKEASSALQPLLVVATRDNSVDIPLVKSSLSRPNSAAANAEQMECVVTIIEEENKLRTQVACSRGVFEAEEQKGLLVESDFAEFEQLDPGLVRNVLLGGHYPAVILDARLDSGPHTYKAAVFLVPRGRAHEWLFSTEEGQWKIIESAQAGRLVVVTLDTQQYPGSLSAVQDELSHVVKHYLPLDCREASNIPYMTTSDGVQRRTVLEEIYSPITGTIKVEDVVLETEIESESGESDLKLDFFRRLVFERNPNLIQSDASLVPSKVVVEDNRRKAPASRHAKKKGKSKDSSQIAKQDGKEEYKVDHSQLASKYHGGMIAGLTLIAPKLEQCVSRKVPIRVMVVGLGAGLLPMFIHNHLPVDNIQVVELDSVIGDLAKRHFGFIETDRMQLHVGDGIEAVHAISRPPDVSGQEPDTSSTTLTSIGTISINESSPETDLADNLGTTTLSGGLRIAKDQRLHVLIIDADSGDPSLEMSCPPQGFLEESFLNAAKAALVDGGILTINVVSRVAGPRLTAISKLQKVFEEVYELKVDDDVNRVLFALPHKSSALNHLSTTSSQSAALTLRRLASNVASWQNGPILDEFLEQGKICLVPKS